jgi:hypothetical protein
MPGSKHGAETPSLLRRARHVVFRPIAGEPILSEVAAVFRVNEASPTVRNLIEQIRESPERRLSP